MKFDINRYILSASISLCDIGIENQFEDQPEPARLQKAKTRITKKTTLISQSR